MAWVILKAEIANRSAVVIFGQKLPSYLLSCMGVLCSIPEKLPTASKVNGELSLSLNGKQIHPIHLNIASNNSPIGNHNQLYSLDEVLKPNALLTGYYMDKSDLETFEPYHLQIYLKCKKS